jgi:hypothetical protein
MPPHERNDEKCVTRKKTYGKELGDMIGDVALDLILVSLYACSPLRRSPKGRLITG